MGIGSIAMRAAVGDGRIEMRDQGKWSRGRPGRQVLFLWAVPVAGTRVQLVVVFDGSIREGAGVNKERDLIVSKLFVAFIFQKTVTVEYPGGVDRTENFTINGGVLSIIKSVRVEE
jgi:hypothetical protein